MPRSLFLYICIGLLLGFNMRAQSPHKVDSLERLAQTESPKEKANIYLEIARLYRQADSSQTAFYAAKANAIAESINDRELLLDSRYYIALAYLHAAYYDQAQDLLEEVLNGALAEKSKKVQVHALGGLGQVEGKRGNYEQSLWYYHNALVLARLKEYHRATGDNLYNIGVIHYRLGAHDVAMEFYEKALAIRTKLKDYEAMASCYNNIGILYYFKGKSEVTLDYFFKALYAYEQCQDLKGLADANNNLGIIYSRRGELDEAITYYRKALKLNRQIGNKFDLASNLTNLGILYRKKNEFDSAYSFFDESQAIRVEIGDSNGLSTTLSAIGATYIEGGQYKTAGSYLRKALAIQENFANPHRISTSLILLGNLSDSIKEWQDAKQFYSRALTISQENEALENMSAAAKGLAKAEKELGDYKAALSAYILHKSSSDSLKDDEKTERVTKLEMEYQFKLERDSLSFASNQAQLELMNKIERTKANQKAMAYLLMLIFSILLASFFFLRLKIRSNEVLNQKNAKIAELNSKLERKARVRAHSLAKRNRSLEKYAYYNSHILRAPLARIIGINQLMQNLPQESEECKVLLENMNLAAKELDDVVHQMQALLDTSDSEALRRALHKVKSTLKNQGHSVKD